MKIRTTVLARTILAAASLILASDVWAEPALDPMFGDHMVLQRGMRVPIWGTADPGQKVTVSFRDQKKETTADQEGKWKVTLDPLKVGAAGKLTVAGKTPRVLSDVLVGDVFIGDRPEGNFIACARNKTEFFHGQLDHFRIYRKVHNDFDAVGAPPPALTQMQEWSEQDQQQHDDWQKRR